MHFVVYIIRFLVDNNSIESIYIMKHQIALQVAEFVTVNKRPNSGSYRCTVDVRTEAGRAVYKLVQRLHRTLNPGKQIKGQGRLGPNNPKAHLYAQGGELHRYCGHIVHLKNAGFIDVYVYDRSV
jgi:hypothetical protein